MAIEKQKNKKTDELLRLRIDFDDEMKMSVNKIWSGGNGTQWIRKKVAGLWHEDLFYFLDEHRIKPIKEKIDMFFEFYFSTGDSGGKRQLDSSNCTMMTKIIEDSLKYDKEKNPKGILVDDTNAQCGWHSAHSIQMTLAERKLLETSYVEVSIRRHNPNL